MMMIKEGIFPCHFFLALPPLDLPLPAFASLILALLALTLLAFALLHLPLPHLRLPHLPL